MFNGIQASARKALLLSSSVLVLVAPTVLAQTAPSAPAGDRWLHVRVIDSSAKGETVRVNVPLDLAEKVLPTINKSRLHNGKIKIEDAKMNDVDLHSMVDAIRSAKDGEYVTVQGTDQDVRVAKSGGHLIVHVSDKSGKKTDKTDKTDKRSSEVEVKIPMKVIDALFSAGKDELDLVAALHALSAQGDTELVSVKDSENTVRVWLDSKNVSD
ncbi:MAG TPA: hypothetical protein VK525_01130 [Candidatus Saccharimonadales bacterium]|nr:hypothetical protein [Candidatus Saccharimonadales bacterium]